MTEEWWRPQEPTGNQGQHRSVSQSPNRSWSHRGLGDVLQRGVLYRVGRIGLVLLGVQELYRIRRSGDHSSDKNEKENWLDSMLNVSWMLQKSMLKQVSIE